MGHRLFINLLFVWWAMDEKESEEREKATHQPTNRNLYVREGTHDAGQRGRRDHARAVNGPVQVDALHVGQVHGQVDADAQVDAQAHEGHVEIPPREEIRKNESKNTTPHTPPNPLINRTGVFCRR